MPGNILRYYFCLEDDQEQVRSILNNLQGFEHIDTMYMAKELSNKKNRKLISHFKHSRMHIIVMQITQENLSPEDCLALVDDLENYYQDVFIGKVTVILNDLMPWGEVLDRLEKMSNRSIEYQLEMKDGKLARMMPAAGHIYYACVPELFSREIQQLLFYGLPLIESRITELRMISNLLRDQIIIIQQERAELDKKLSDILHANLVTESDCDEQVEKLENHIREISSSYGIITGNSNVLAQGQSRIEGLIFGLQRQLRSEPALVLSESTIEEISAQYLRRLDEISDLNELLKNARESHVAAIEVVRSRIDIMNSRTNLITQEKIRDLMEINTSIQKQSLVFQFAAGLIEFIVLAYYSHSLWKNIAYTAYNTVPGEIQLFFVLLFSGLTTYLTHNIAEYVQGEKHLKRKIFILAGILLMLIIFIFVLSLTIGSAAHY